MIIVVFVELLEVLIYGASFLGLNFVEHLDNNLDCLISPDKFSWLPASYSKGILGCMTLVVNFET
jgi:hypothetical protein